MRAQQACFAGILTFAILFPATADRTSAAEPHGAAVRQSLGELRSWVDRGPNGAGWRTYLRSNDLLAQLERGDKADAQVVGEILARYESSASGLDLAPFAAARRALAAWHGELVVAAPNADLPEFVRSHSDKFRPITDADVASAKADLQSAVARMERYWTPGAKNTTDWFNYLQLPALKEELAKDAPDLKRLGGMSGLYVENHAGLELEVMTDVGDALQRYGELATMSRQENLKQVYEQGIATLADALARYEKKPTLADHGAIGKVIDQLRASAQAPDVVAAVQRKYSAPNLYVRASNRIADAGVARDVDQVDPIHDNILGTQIEGTGHTVGRVGLRLVPNSSQAELETLFTATTHTDTVGHNGPATLYSRGVTDIFATKRLIMDEFGFATLPANCTATTDNEVQDVDAGWLVRKIAWRKIGKSRDKANAIASGRAEDRVSRKMDDEAAEQLAEANKNFRNKLRLPLIRLREYPRHLSFSTTDDDLLVISEQANRSQIAAPGAPPAESAESDLCVRIHETMINNLIEGLLGGRTVNDDQMRQAVIDIKGELPEKLKVQADEDPWSITFARRQPITLEFDADGFVMTIRGTRYTSGDRSYDAMNVRAVYKFALEGNKGRFTRQGEVETVPPGFRPGTDKLNASEIALKKVLEKKLGKVFTPEIIGEGIELPGKWKSLGKLHPVTLAAQAGWLHLAWRVPTETAEPQPHVALK